MGANFRWHFEMHFLEWKVWNILLLRIWLTINALVRIMALHQLPELMLTKLMKSYGVTRHQWGRKFESNQQLQCNCYLWLHTNHCISVDQFYHLNIINLVLNTQDWHFKLLLLVPLLCSILPYLSRVSYIGSYKHKEIVDTVYHIFFVYTQYLRCVPNVHILYTHNYILSTWSKWVRKGQGRNW